MNAYTQFKVLQAQIAEGLSNTAYHQRAEFSSSQLKDMLRSAAHFYSNSILKENDKPSKACMDFGTLAHTLFLEPEQFWNEFVITPKFNRRTKDGKAEAEAWESANEHKICVTQEQVDGAQRIVENLQTLSIYNDMRNNYGMAEASIFYKDPEFNLELRIRPDWHIAPCNNFPNGLIIDLKTTTDARPHAFSKKCGDFAYDLSCAMYREGFQQAYNTEEKPPFIFLVAESSAPYNVKQYKASDLFIAVGEKRYNQAKEQLAESLLIKEWDGYGTELEEISLPAYLTQKALND